MLPVQKVKNLRRELAKGLILARAHLDLNKQSVLVSTPADAGADAGTAAGLQRGICLPASHPSSRPSGCFPSLAGD